MAADLPFTAENEVNASEALDPATGYFGNTDTFYATLTLDSQGKSKVIGPLTLPVGFKPMLMFLYSTVTLGSAAIAVGTEASPELYRATAVHTTGLAPEISGIVPAALESPQEVVITNDDTATLPAAGTLTLVFAGRRD